MALGLVCHLSLASPGLPIPPATTTDGFRDEKGVAGNTGGWLFPPGLDPEPETWELL